MLRFEELFYRYLDHLTTEEEELELMRLLNDNTLRDKKEQLIDAAYDQLKVKYQMTEEQADGIFQQIIPQTSRVVQMAPRRAVRWWVAASVIVLLAAGSYFLFFNNSSQTPNPKPEIVLHEVTAPQTNHATITLANGQKIFLDSAANGALVTQNRTKLIKTENGKIVYSIDSSQLKAISSQLTYNTLTNPRGSKVTDLTLSDGTRVWLNAESSITYPVAFMGNERKVSLTGEAYFEVVHNASKPFHVMANNTDIEDVGTSFNVSAYDNEPAMKITLVEGSIEVALRQAQGQKSRVKIAPAEQLSFDKDGNSSLNKKADIELALAWKNGLTKFKSADIKTIMRQVERWYNIDVSYEGNIPERSFTGGVSSSANLSELLKILELSNIHFRVEGRKLVVTP